LVVVVCTRCNSWSDIPQAIYCILIDVQLSCRFNDCSLAMFMIADDLRTCYKYTRLYYLKMQYFNNIHFKLVLVYQ